MLIVNCRGLDFDFDGDIDITCYGGGVVPAETSVRGVFVRNDGGMNFTVILMETPKILLVALQKVLLLKKGDFSPLF